MVLDFLIDESSQFDSVKMDNVDFTRQLNLPIETSDDEEKSAVSIYKTGVKFCQQNFNTANKTKKEKKKGWIKTPVRRTTTLEPEDQMRIVNHDQIVAHGFDIQESDDEVPQIRFLERENIKANSSYQIDDQVYYPQDGVGQNSETLNYEESKAKGTHSSNGNKLNFHNVQKKNVSFDIDHS